MIHLMTMTFYAKLFYFISFSSDTVVVSNYGFFSGAAPALLLARATSRGVRTAWEKRGTG